MNTQPEVWKNPAHFLAFGLGSGLSPKAPGTVGTIAAIPFYCIMQYLPLWQYASILIVAVIFGIWLCDKVSRDLGVHDHSGIVWDEFCGYWLTMLSAPSGWGWVLYGFILFRLFDVWKPWPISWLDGNVAGGWGIMIDDIVAGIFALAVLKVTVYFL